MLTIVGLAAAACKSKSPTDSGLSSTTSDSGIRYVTPKDGLNMREEPSVTGKKMLTIPRGAQVQKVEEKPESFKIDNIEGKWTKISWQGKAGWVFGGFLSKSDPELSPSANSSDTTNDKVDCERRCDEKARAKEGRCDMVEMLACGRQNRDCSSEVQKCIKEETDKCLRECS